MKSTLLKVTALLLAAIALAACSSSSRSVVTVQESTTITKGQELVDLQRALTEGAVTEREFERLRQVIMDRPR